MHRAGAYIASQIGASQTKQAALSLVITSQRATAISAALADDGRDYFYSACVSLVDGVRGLNCGFYTWAAVKLYYSVFYAMRSMLASDGVCLFYVDHKPFWVVATAGASITKWKGKTHEAVLDLFGKTYPTHALLSLPIGGVPALDWITKRRENSNYNFPRHIEPEAPNHFKRLEVLGVRKLVAAYQTDTRQQYIFDQDHAMLAYPLAVLTEAGNFLYQRGGTGIGDDELGFLVSECRDDSGPLTPLTQFFERIV